MTPLFVKDAVAAASEQFTSTTRSEDVAAPPATPSSHPFQWAAAVDVGGEVMEQLLVTRLSHECSCRAKQAFACFAVPGSSDVLLWQTAGEIAGATALAEAERLALPAAQGLFKQVLTRMYT